jgi:hypothetical protein
LKLLKEKGTGFGYFFGENCYYCYELSSHLVLCARIIMAVLGRTRIVPPRLVSLLYAVATPKRISSSAFVVTSF